MVRSRMIPRRSEAPSSTDKDSGKEGSSDVSTDELLLALEAEDNLEEDTTRSKSSPPIMASSALPPDALPPPVVPPPPPGNNRRQKGASAPERKTASQAKDHPLRTQMARLVAHFEEQAAEEGDTRRAAVLHQELGRIYESIFYNEKRALRHFEQALELSPGHLPSIRAARRLLLRAKRFQDALTFFDDEIRLSSEPWQKAILHFDKGCVLEHHLRDPRAAQEVYQKGIELNRQDLTLLESLGRLEFAQEQWSLLSQTVEKLTNAVPSDPAYRAALLLQRALLCEYRVKDRKKATQLYEAALELDPQVPVAAEALFRLYHEQNRWRDLVQVLELEVKRSTDSADQAKMLALTASLHEAKLGNVADAVEAQLRAHQHAPEELDLLERLAGLYEKAGDMAALAENLVKLIALSANPQDKVRLQQRLGGVLEHSLGDSDGAVHWHEQALALDPGYTPSLEALTSLYTQRGQWDELIKMHLTEAESTRDAERAAGLFAQVARIFEAKQHKLDEAIRYHSRAMSTLPGYESSFRALSRLFAQQQEWEALAVLNEQAAAQTKNATRRLTFLLKAGSLFEDKLQDYGRAANLYKRALSAEPGHLEAVHALQRAAELGGKFEELIETLKHERNLTETSGEAAVLLNKIGEVYEERIEDQDAALAHYREALKADANLRAVIANLRRFFHRHGRWEELLEIYEHELGLVSEQRSATQLLCKMAALCENHLGDDSRATQYYKRALERKEDLQEALDPLSAIYRKRSDWQSLVQLLTHSLKSLTASHALAAAHYEIAQLCEEKLGDRERALQHYEQCLQKEPKHWLASRARIRCLSADEQWAKVSEAWSFEAGVTQDPIRTVTALTSQAVTLEVNLGDAKGAHEALARARAHKPEHLSLLLMIAPLLRKLDASAAYRRILWLIAQIAREPAAQAAALKQLAVYERHRRTTESPKDMVEALEELLKIVPEDLGALLTLEEAALQARDHGQLSRVDRQWLSMTQDPKSRSSYATRLAQSLESNHGSKAGRAELEEPLRLYQEALANEPLNITAAHAFARLAEHLASADLQAEAASLQARATGSAKEASAFYVKSGTIKAHQLERQEEAAEDLRLALELQPDSKEAAQGLTDVMLTLGQVRPLVKYLAEAAGATDEAEASATLGVHAARLQAEVLEEPEEALQTLRSTLRKAPEHLDARRKLAELSQLTGQWYEAAKHLESVAELTSSKSESLESRVRLAQIYQERLNRLEVAEMHLRSVLEQDPQQSEALERLAAIRFRQGDAETARTLTERRVQSSGKSEEAQALALSELAEYCQALGDGGAATRARLDAVRILGHASEAAERYQVHAHAPVEWHAYLEALEDYRKRLVQRGHTTASTSFECARVQIAMLNDREAGLLTLHRALEAHPESPELLLLQGRTLRDAQELEPASESFQAAIVLDPLRAESWRELSQTLRESRQEEEALATMSALVVLGEASGQERVHASARRAHTAEANADSLGPTALRKLMPLASPEVEAATLLQTLSDCLPKLYPPDLEAYGLTSRDRLSPRDHPVLIRMVSQIASIFGVSDYELYVHELRANDIAVELSEKPSLLVPSRVLDLGQTQQVFLVSRIFAIIALKFQAVVKLTPRELEVVLASAARTVDSTFGQGLTSESYLDEQNRRIVRAMPRRDRRQLQEVAADYIARAPVDFASLVSYVDRLASAAALLVADDLQASLEALSLSRRDLRKLTLEEALAKDTLLPFICSFWVSPAAKTFRAWAYREAASH